MKRIEQLRAAEHDDYQREIYDAVERIRVDSDWSLPFRHIGTRDLKSPDSSIAFDADDIKYPPVVVEVAHSQQRKKLPELAEFYIGETRGHIKTVIAIDIEYRSPNKPTAALGREAVFSIYRNRVVRDDVTGELKHREAHPDPENQCFRRQDLTVPDGVFELFLSDFCPPGTLGDSNNTSIHITHQTLADLLSYAEKRKAAVETPLRDDDGLERNLPFKSKRKRSPTPGLTEEDEAVFQDAEAEEEARAEEKDASFGASSSFSTVEDDLPQRRKIIKTAPDSDL
jgi:hypothetical protein